MPFDAKVYKVLIASPSDVQAERDAVTQAIHDWNDDHSEAEGISFVPIRWERHAAPELGDRPQELINKYLGDKSDLLIAIFWSKLGSPTGKEESGTVEEIKEFKDAGKLAMVYFCKRAIPQELIDHEQLSKLHAFRKEIEALGIYNTFKEIQDLKEDLTRHLTIQMRRLKESRGRPDQRSSDSMTTRLSNIQTATAPSVLPPEKDGPVRAMKVVSDMATARKRLQESKERIAKERQEFEQLVLEKDYHNFQAKRGIFALSILPFTPTTNRLELASKGNTQLLEMLRPTRASQGSRVERFRNAVLVRYPYPPGEPASAITTLSDRGSLFSVVRWFSDSIESDKVINWNPHDLWGSVVNDVRRYLTTFKSFGIPSPWTVGISLLNMKRSLAVPEPGYEFLMAQHIRVNDENNICLEPSVPDEKIDLLNTESIRQLLEPNYKDVWLQYGYGSVPMFNEKNEFIGMTPVPS
jgi:hypothetical protein